MKLTDRHAIQDGMLFSVPYPFVHDTYESLEHDGQVEIVSWKPGVRFEDRRANAYCEPEPEAVADGVGVMRLYVVSVHKPGRFPTRVFYTRKWVPPSGNPFGKDGLRVTTLDAFRRRATKYQHTFVVRLEAAAGRAVLAREDAPVPAKEG